MLRPEPLRIAPLDIPADPIAPVDRGDRECREPKKPTAAVVGIGSAPDRPPGHQHVDELPHRLLVAQDAVSADGMPERVYCTI